MQPDMAGPRGVSNGVLIAMLCNISSWQLKCGGDGDGAMFTDRSTQTATSQTATSSSDLTFFSAVSMSMMLWPNHLSMTATMTESPKTFTMVWLRSPMNSTAMMRPKVLLMGTPAIAKTTRATPPVEGMGEAPTEQTMAPMADSMIFVAPNSMPCTVHNQHGMKMKAIPLPSMLIVAPKDKARSRTSARIPFLAAHCLVVGKVAMEEDIPKAINTAGMRFL
mmetsp:Transcript_3922/g.5613  ORF Transcript_3922/g.5613 Transcript_3922/m.5613 type:complete len:221 (-) Transcript_3922:734-1396(-)